ncbi:MAG: aquaporin family protein [Acidimicrobiia bacterium]|nr:aquaporin family protein [Acidimicrobiia bacterium]
MAQAVPLTRRFVAEALGTGLLIVSVVGSGVMATNLTADVALQLLANAGATVGALIALILMFGPISGAHFNPVVTIADCVLNGRSWKDVVPYFLAQTSGGVLGALVANLMFDLDPLGPSTKIRDGGGIWLGEVVATFGLLLVIFLSSTSLANPAVTIARAFSESFAGIAPESVPMFIVMQFVGLVVALPVLRLLRR